MFLEKYFKYMKTFLTILISVLILVSLFLAFKSEAPKEVEKDFIQFKDIGQIALDEEDKLKLQTFLGKDLEVLGSDIIINAGHEYIELRVGNVSKIRIERDNIFINTNNLFINNELYGK